MKGGTFIFYMFLGAIILLIAHYFKSLDTLYLQGITTGFFLCLGCEFLAALTYLRWRIMKKQGTSKITLSVATLELKTLFGEESEEEIVNTYRNRNFFINKFSHEKRLMSSVFRRDETYNFNLPKGQKQSGAAAANGNMVTQLDKIMEEPAQKQYQQSPQLGPKNEQNLARNFSSPENDKSQIKSLQQQQQRGEGTPSQRSIQIGSQTPQLNRSNLSQLNASSAITASPQPPKQQQQQQNGLDHNKETTHEQKKHILEDIETLVFTKVGRKVYLNKVSTFRKFLETFIGLEKNFAKELRGIGKPRFLKTCMFDVVVKRDERYHHSCRISTIEPQFKLDYLAVIQLSESKSTSFDNLLIILPNWIYMKNLFLEVSRLHDQLVQYIQFGIFDLTKVLIEEYEDSYKKLKVLKTEAQEVISKKMEEAKTQEKAYQEISKRIKDLAAVYEKQHSGGEKELARKRVELKGEIELLLFDKNNSKIKAYAAYEALQKARVDANKVNLKVAQHKKNWEKRFQTLYKTSMKSIISGFFDMSKDIQKNLKSILAQNLKQSAVQPTIAFDTQSFRDDLSAYSSVNGSQSSSKQNYFNQPEFKSRNGSFMTESNRSRHNTQLTQQQVQSGTILRNTSRNITQLNLNNNNNNSSSSISISPQLLCADHRQQLIDFVRSTERFEREFDEITKYEPEVTYLIEDICTSINAYLSELENKIQKVKYFSILGDSIVYEQLGTCIQVDIANSLKLHLRSFATQSSNHLKQFQQATQKHQSIFATELKKLRSNTSIAQELQASLERISNNVAPGRDALTAFQQKYDAIKSKFDTTYETLYAVKSEIENTIKGHEKAVEDYKRHVINALVVYANQSSEKLEVIENNSDTILSAEDEEASQFNGSDDTNSNHSQASHQQYPMMKRSSTFFAGSEFMHQYGHADEIHERGLGGIGTLAHIGTSEIGPAQANDPYNRKAAAIITKLLKIFYRQWKDADYFKEKIKKELYISLNKKLEDSLEEMVVTKLIIKGEGPDIKSIVQQKSEENEFLLDIEISYKGTVYLEVETAYHIDWPKPDSYKLPLTVKIKLNEFYSILRVCYVPRVFGKSWFSFIGEPVLSLQIDPIISKKYQVSRIPRVTTLIQEIISQKIKKMTFPNRDSIKIPLSKADKEISAIRDKLLHKKQTVILPDSAAPSKSNIHLNPYKNING